MKGIILAGGMGTRLYPSTMAVSKQLLPIYDKPLIYYPLSVLMLAGIRDILVIVKSGDLINFQKLLGDGSWIGANISYVEQKHPNGIADAFLVGEKFIGSSTVSLILGDNIFYGYNFSTLLQKSVQIKSGAEIYAYWVKNPSSFGVVKLDADDKPLQILEKPDKFVSNYAITGLYFYDNDVVNIAKHIKPSSRGELEISSINQEYLNRNQLHVEILGRGHSWLDTGTPRSMNDASTFVRTIEGRQGLKIACPEEIAFANGWIDKDKIIETAADRYKNNAYGKYLLKIIEMGNT